MENFLKPKAAAGYLGMALSSVYKLAHMKKVPYYKFNGLKFKKEDLDSYIESSRVKPVKF